MLQITIKNFAFFMIWNDTFHDPFLQSIETLNSTEVNIACFQKYIQGWNLTEDCLILNIWTRYPQPKNATVMVR